MHQYNFFTYILTNTSKKVVYVGVTNDLATRLTEHYLSKSFSKTFAGKYKCYYLVWFERHQYINNAIEREKELKSWSREKKNKLITEFNPDWRFLNKDVMDWPPIIKTE